MHIINRKIYMKIIYYGASARHPKILDKIQRFCIVIGPNLATQFRLASLCLF